MKVIDNQEEEKQIYSNNTALPRLL